MAHSSPLHQELSRFIQEAYAQLSAKLPAQAFQLAGSLRKLAPILAPFTNRFGLPDLAQLPDLEQLPRLVDEKLASIAEPELRGYLTLLRDQVGSLLERTAVERTAPAADPQTQEPEPELGDGDAGQRSNDGDEPGDVGSDDAA